MGLDSWRVVEKGAFESAEVFADPPFKSRQFLAITSIVVLLAIFDIGVLVRFFSRISWLAVVYVLLILITVLGNWARVIVVHQRLHELYTTNKIADIPVGSDTDVALRAASTLSYWGTLAASAIGVLGLAILTQIVKQIK